MCTLSCGRFGSVANDSYVSIFCRSVQFFRVAEGENPVAPFESGVEYHRHALNDDKSYWCSAYKVVYSKSLLDGNVQQIEVSCLP